MHRGLAELGSGASRGVAAMRTAIPVPERPIQTWELGCGRGVSPCWHSTCGQSPEDSACRRLTAFRWVLVLNGRVLGRQVELCRVVLIQVEGQIKVGKSVSKGSRTWETRAQLGDHLRVSCSPGNPPSASPHLGLTGGYFFNHACTNSTARTFNLRHSLPPSTFPESLSNLNYPEIYFASTLCPSPNYCCS